MDDLYSQFEQQGDDEISDHLLELLMAARKTKWDKTTKEMNFTHSSRKGWVLLRHLGETSKPQTVKSKIHPEKIASTIIRNSKKVPVKKHHNRAVKTELRQITNGKSRNRSPFQH